jgi:hypothetical protein
MQVFMQLSKTRDVCACTPLRVGVERDATLKINALQRLALVGIECNPFTGRVGSAPPVVVVFTKQR